MLQRPRHLDQNFSLAQARSLIGDLFAPNPRIYWTDFLLSVLVGHAAYFTVRFAPELATSPNVYIPLQVVAFVISGLSFYRAALFIHELTHLPQEKFKWFRIAWNVLCGIPFLVPSFVYYTHIDHHRRKHFGTSHDGEYMQLGRHGWWYIAYYLALSPFIPIAAVFRFGVLTPLTWLHPAIRNWVHRHASSMVMDPAYLRPLPTEKTLRIIRLQEIACFVVIWAVVIVPPVFLNRWAIPLVIQGYLTSLFIILLNAVRTMGAHRWWNDGRELTFVDQMLDSVTVADNAWVSELWGPVGTRFHALHHLFPSLPYHAMPEAHRRLMAQLPADSPYRGTVEPSLTAALVDLLKRARESQQTSHVAPVATSGEVSMPA